LGEWIIWALFVLHFLIMFSLAESKRRYLRRNWLVVLSLFIPVLRIFAIARAVSALRAITATRVVAYTNRALRQLGQILPARRIVFAVASTLVVILAAAVGLLALERDAPGSTITSFGEALWFATRATMELDVNIEPVTAEGRVLSILVSLYGKAVFGVVTAALASWFIAIDRRVEEQRQRADG
jgi:voltage-gated potassium channel